MYRFYENTFRDLMSLVKWTEINGIQEMHDIVFNWADSICCYSTYLHTSDNTFFKIITGFTLTIKCQVVGEKPCWKNFYFIEEPIIYI